MADARQHFATEAVRNAQCEQLSLKQRAQAADVGIVLNAHNAHPQRWHVDTCSRENPAGRWRPALCGTMEFHGRWRAEAVAELRLLARNYTARLGLTRGDTRKLWAATLLGWWQTASCALWREEWPGCIPLSDAEPLGQQCGKCS